MPSSRSLLAACVVFVVLSTLLVTLRGSSIGAVGTAVLQGVNVVVSVYGAVVFTRGEVDKRVRAAAQSSARRVLVLFAGLSQTVENLDRVRLRVVDAGGNQGKASVQYVELALEGLADQLRAQLNSVDAAVQDWRDIATDEVDEEISRFQEKVRNRG